MEVKWLVMFQLVYNDVLRTERKKTREEKTVEKVCVLPYVMVWVIKSRRGFGKDGFDVVLKSIGLKYWFEDAEVENERKAIQKKCVLAYATVWG